MKEIRDKLPQIFFPLLIYFPVPRRRTGADLKIRSQANHVIYGRTVHWPMSSQAAVSNRESEQRRRIHDLPFTGSFPLIRKSFPSKNPLICLVNFELCVLFNTGKIGNSLHDFFVNQEFGLSIFGLNRTHLYIPVSNGIWKRALKDSRPSKRGSWEEQIPM